MSNAYRLCPTAKSALSLGRMSLAPARPFSAGTYVDQTRPSTPRQSNATTQRSLRSPRAPQNLSPFNRSGDMSQLSKAFTRPAPDSVRSPVNTDAHTRDSGTLRFEPTPPSATEKSLTPLYPPSSNTPLSLDEREPILTPAQYEEWADVEKKNNRIARMPQV
jgi:hypothetical protein